MTPAPKVRKSSLRDARKLFGENFKTKVTLRKSGYLGAYEEISLLQFDPKFTSSEVICCHPSCSTKNSEAAKSGTKGDLFLCPIHHQVLKNSILTSLQRGKIKLSTSTEKPKHGLFAGYTSLIRGWQRGGGGGFQSHITLNFSIKSHITEYFVNQSRVT